MPKINIDGVTREMTTEEVTEMERNMEGVPESMSNPTEMRMQEIEAALIEIAAMLGGA